MNKRILMGLIVASMIVVGFSTAPALAALVFNVGGGGDPNQIKKVNIKDKDTGDGFIDEVKFKIKGKVATDGSQGQIGYALLTNVAGVALGVTSHDVFYDNVGQGSGPGISDCGTGALASGMNAGLCTFKLPCSPGDDCGPEWHIHYVTVVEDPVNCPDGFKITDLTYAQPGQVTVNKNTITIQNLDQEPGPMLSSLSGTTLDIGSFTSLDAFAPLSISATIDDAGPTFEAACLTPVNVNNNDDDDDDDDD